jgi:hypothetical protein
MNAKAQMNALRAALNASQVLTAALGDITGGVGLPTVPGLYQDYLPPDLRGAPKDLFFYRIDILAVAAGAAGQGAFTVQSDSDFEVCYLSASVTDPAAPETAVTFNGLLFTMEDSGSGRSLQNGALPLSAVVGNGTLPGYVPWPKFLDRASQFTVNVTNNQTAQAVDVRLVFAGFKVFSPSQAGMR